MKIVILDSGHSEYVPGKEAPDKSFREWEFNNDMQYRILEKAKKCGIDVYLTNPNPEGKSEIGLTKRANLANDYYIGNNKNDSLFISIHANAYKDVFNDARGSETYIASNASENSKRAARIMQDEVYSAAKNIDDNAKDRGVKVSDFTVIYKARMPSILVEYGFYTNYDDLDILKNNKEELASATVRGICEYFGVEYVEDSDDMFYRVVCGSFRDKENADKRLEELKALGYDDCFIVKTTV